MANNSGLRNEVFDGKVIFFSDQDTFLNEKVDAEKYDLTSRTLHQSFRFELKRSHISKVDVLYRFREIERERTLSTISPTLRRVSSRW